MMATLIIRSQAKCVPWDGQCTTFVHFPKAVRTRWFEKAADVCPIVWNGSGPHKGGRARWRRQDTVHKCFVKSTEIVFAAVPPCSTIEITCNQLNFVRNHDGTKSESEIIGDASILGVNVADMKREHCKVLLSAHW